MEQSNDSSHQHTGVGMAPTLDISRTLELAPREGSSTKLCLGVDPCQGSSLSSPLAHRTATNTGLQKGSPNNRCLELVKTEINFSRIRVSGC